MANNNVITETESDSQEGLQMGWSRKLAREEEEDKKQRLRYLALHLALLLQPEVLWGISHTGKARLRVVPEESTQKEVTIK